MNDNQISDIKTLATRHKMENCEQISDTNGAFGACVRAFFEWEDCKERNQSMLKALERIAAIPHKTDGGDWDEIEEAQRIAREALKRD